MKLRLQGSSLRFRLDADEVHELVETGRVYDRVVFGPHEDLEYAVETHDDEEIAIVRSPGRIIVLLPRTDTEDWAYNDVIGFEAEAENGEDGLTITVEKDLPCEHPSNA